MRHLKIKNQTHFTSLHSLYISQKQQNQVLTAELAGLREELANKTFQSYLLYEINKAINTFMEPVDIAAMILQALVTHTGAEASSIMLLDKASSEFEVIAHSGIENIDHELVDFQENFQDYQPWETMQTKQPFLEKSPERQSDLSLSLNNYVLCIPMIYDKEALGTINIHTMGPKYRLLDHHIEFVQNLAGQAALAFQNSFMYSVLKQQTLVLEQQAITDGLTGLHNHRSFQQKLSEEMLRSRRYHHSLSIIMFDIDHFKKFNDTYGHQFGDEVLRTIANLTKKSIRTVDIPARYGGEEFAVILPHTDIEGAETVAERIRSSIANHVFTNETQTFHVNVTVSLGIAECNQSCQKTELIEAADQALYRAKKNGRNQIQINTSLKIDNSEGEK